MALFKHIQAVEDLPAVGTSYEREHLDFKRRIGGGGTYEQAKDVASFANRTGGVILVGAEDDKDRLARYVPMTDAEAHGTRTRFIDAVKDRCLPAPKCDVEVIAHTGGFVVAVNVWPVPGQPVGVKVPVSKGPGDKISDSAFVFPIRVLTGTDYLEPQELAKVMLPDLRRNAIALDMIPTTERRDLLVWFREASGSGEALMKGHLLSVDIHTGRASFSLVFGADSLAVELPLEAIQSVQPTGGPSGRGRVWRISLRGQVTHQGDLGIWIPPR
jgi:hypothetical protein